MTQTARELAHAILNGDIWADQDAETVAEAYLEALVTLDLQKPGAQSSRYPKEQQMTDVKETTETTETVTEKPGETTVERETSETTEPVTADGDDDDGA